MHTKQIIATGLVTGGIILLFFGISAADSFSSDVSKVFTDTPTDKSMWMIVGGIILVVMGAIGTLRFRGAK